MVSQNLPSPGAENRSGVSKRQSPSGGKSAKSSHRASKRATTAASIHHHHDPVAHGNGMDSRHKRVWKACERCRMKKTKCDGEFPCKRCKDDGLVCTAGVRKKIEYKQLPRGYAEVLENTQLTLIATVHKLYSMVRNSQSWDLGEPDLNDRGQPIIHNIAQKLGCIRPNSDIDLPVHSVFPEDEASMGELARQLEEQQQTENEVPIKETPGDLDMRRNSHTDRASSSEFDHSDIEPDYRMLAFGNTSGMTLSPQSFTDSADFDFSSTSTKEIDSGMFTTQSSSLPTLTTTDWSMPRTHPAGTLSAMQFMQQTNGLPSVELLHTGMLSPDFGTIKPEALSCAHADIMMGFTDPMIFSNFENEMRL